MAQAVWFLDRAYGLTTEEIAATIERMADRSLRRRDRHYNRSEPERQGREYQDGHHDQANV